MGPAGPETREEEKKKIKGRDNAPTCMSFLFVCCIPKEMELIASRTCIRRP